MNRSEALHTLGLDESASADDIKAAYRESAQILHPDRFASNKRLQDRATEQFKNLQAAYDYLQSGAGAKASTSTRAKRSRGYSRSDEIEAQLAGIQAARTQLVAERDALLDSRRNAFILMGLGVVGALLLRRIPAIAALGGALIVWGIVQFVSTMGNLNTLNEHLGKLKEQKHELMEELDDLE